jgi:ATP-binding cassette subfamily C protein
VYAFAGYRLLPALQVIFQGATHIRYSTAALEEVHQMVRLVDARIADPDAFADVDALEALPFRDRIRFEDVGFAYATSGPVLQDVDLEIPSRASVAFVGPTGAGKTTLIDLLLGLLTPTSGRITVDGTELDAATRPRWQARLGYVPQAIYLTDDTVARNIALGLPDERIDPAAVRRAARLAQVDAFVEQELPRGYETVVGERGIRLSGGQRQRIGIARALYHDPDVLVFDEATSALDGTTEDAVYGAIRDLVGEKTVVTIAHRLATVREADRIFLLDRGRLAAAGTYPELLRESALFRAMAREGDARPSAGTPSSYP